MLCSLALLSVMVVAAFGAGAGGPPPLCCMPDQFRVTNVYANTNVGKAGVSHHMVRSVSAYDFVNHQEVYYTTRNYPNGSQEQLDYYLDYPENRMYVFNNQTGECIKARMNKQHGKRCVPGFSTVTDAHFTYGAGQDSIPAYRAIFYSPRLDGNHLYTAMTVGPNCIPVVVKLTIFPWGAGGLETETIEYNDVSIGEIPEYMFNRPKECCKAKFGTPTVFPGLHFDFKFSKP